VEAKQREVMVVLRQELLLVSSRVALDCELLDLS
jgi:hypothetical protein